MPNPPPLDVVVDVASPPKPPRFAMVVARQQIALVAPMPNPPPLDVVADVAPSPKPPRFAIVVGHL
jgi:hypothetical protein